LSIEKLDVNGFTANHGWTWSESKFMPPSIFYAYSDPNEPTSSVETKVNKLSSYDLYITKSALPVLYICCILYFNAEIIGPEEICYDLYLYSC
jgi:hypothetical protein